MTDAQECFMAAEDLSELINGQGNGNNILQVIPDPVVSFLTAGSTLEQEAAGGSTTINPGDNGAGDSGITQILPSSLLLLLTIFTILFA